MTTYSESWIDERAASALARARELAAGLKASAPATALETLRIWDDVTLALHSTSGLASLLANVHPEEAVRTAAEAAELAAQKLSTELAQDAALYAVFDGLAVDGLDPLAARFHATVLRDFRRAGVDRDDATRARLQEINERLLELDQEFSRIARDDVRTVRVAPGRLAGLPADFIASHPPAEDGLVTLTTDYPDTVPVADYAHDGELRRELRKASFNRGYPAADPVLHEILDLRHEYATTLGYADWASYDAEVKMIGTGEAIPAFIDTIADAAREPGERDLAILLERYRRDVPDAERVALSDSAYYRNLVFAERFDLDTQLVRTYFDFPKVRAGLLEVTGRLFGVRYDQVDVTTWHEDVASYDVVRLEDGATLGRIHLDLFPREGKYKHAAQFDLAPGVAGKSLAEGVLVCNFSRGLMEHDHVVTLFHEFGHLVHHVLGGQGAWTRFAGVATEWDFVEAPSQMLEEWAWDPAVLASFATDEAGEPIPAELVAKMRAAEEFGKGYLTQTQTFYAAVSYYFHHERPADLTVRMRELMAQYAPFPYIEDTHFWASFGHLGGYSSAYYTYQWSLVIAKDLFSAFDPGDLFDTEVAGRYRDRVLAPGGSKDAADLVEDFLGRPFSFDAYAAWLAH
ncbi:M3 family metallopeptidase [Nocardioides nematodiphilus]|uniref:M3 family metallopeptidase n=1 Tax=Nocardioides nematodiphilus TaxID=2849669 RepID=UPI001CD97E8D|nr:M3 family metallopeptidase [Nocardioides nematodiphilus]MCA1981838.1 Zn-dependent oligopeptidase [Nocardioides nematodiphilus]